MAFRKFGTSDEHTVEVDRKDKQGISKNSVKQEPFTEKDREELRRETEES